jgi:hypothetical protein
MVPACLAHYKKLRNSQSKASKNLPKILSDAYELAGGNA